MFKKTFNVIASLFCLAIFIATSTAYGYEVPRQDSKTRYFYLFGPQGNPLDGKDEDPTFELNIDVPQDAKDDVTIKVYDADTSGQLDAGVAPWNTEMEFSVSGESELDKKTFSQVDGDGAYTQFGPYSKDKGKKVGDNYRFTLKVTALSGDDLNLFSVKISPDYAEAFSSKFTFVLLPKTGDKMYFYPEIPAGINKLIVRNFDLDQDGGVSKLFDPATRGSYKINDSESGKWSETEIPISSDNPRRLEYRISTTYQTNGHAGLEIKDDKGNSLPIYFRKGKKPVVAEPVKETPAPAPAPAPKATLACNQFTFDARSSYDENNDKISYLWEFGDGATSEEAVVTHVYEKGGKYNVTLKVTDNSGLECSTSTTNQDVEVNTPPQAGLEAPELTCVGHSVTLNASASKDGETAELAYFWRFSDGTTAEGPQVTKTFEKGGVYDVVLTVDDKAGTSCSVDSVRKTIRVNTPPVANAGQDVTLYLKNPSEPYKVNFDGSKSYDVDKNNLTYVWDFGDGSKGEGAKVDHVYEKGGQYEAKLFVDDNTGAGCDTDVASVKVDLNKGPIADAGQSQSVCEGTSIKFSAEGSSDPDNDALTYSWSFGDGETGEGASVEHSYKQAGKYNVVLTVDDGRGTASSKSTDVTSVFINGRPTADLKGTEKACTWDTISFDASASSDPDGSALRYIWDFGDGTTAEGKSKVTHKYEKGGSYQVRVTVDDGSEGVCGTASASLSVKINTPPTANAGPNLTCCQDQSSTFDGSASADPDGDTLTYKWDFGDGEGSDESKTTHAYAKSGAYKAVLSVDDNSGTSCSQSYSSFTAVVNAKPVPVIKVHQK